MTKITVDFMIFRGFAANHFALRCIMSKSMKKIICVLLSAIMLLSLSIFAFAADGDDVQPTKSTTDEIIDNLDPGLIDAAEGVGDSVRTGFGFGYDILQKIIDFIQQIRDFFDRMSAAVFKTYPTVAG